MDRRTSPRLGIPQDRAKFREVSNERVLTPGECKVQRILEGIGMKATPLAEGEDPSADFRVCGFDERYLVEVKDRNLSEDDEERLRARREVAIEDGLGSTPSIARRIGEAVTQLESSASRETPPVEGVFRLVALYAAPLYARVSLEQFRSTFYGSAMYTHIGDARAFEVLYVGFNAAHRHPSVDGIICLDDSRVQLCLNEFSPRYQAMKESHVCQWFAENGALCDPSAMEAAGEVFSMRDCSVNRRDERSMEEAVRSKLGDSYSRVNLKSIVMMVSVPLT